MPEFPSGSLAGRDAPIFRDRRPDQIRQTALLGDRVSFRRDQISHIEEGRVCGVIYCNGGIEVATDKGDKIRLGHLAYTILDQPAPITDG